MITVMIVAIREIRIMAIAIAEIISAIYEITEIIAEISIVRIIAVMNFCHLGLRV